MRVTVNDQPTDLPDSTSVADLLATLALAATDYEKSIAEASH